MDRKSFLATSSKVLLVGIPFISFVGCSSDDDPPGPNGSNADCLANGTSTSIGGNHGHSITVSKTDVQNGTEKTYPIQGSSGHTHNVTVTATHFTSLQNNQSVSVSSTTGSGHTHTIGISCA